MTRQHGVKVVGRGDGYDKVICGYLDTIVVYIPPYTAG
jgi:hypothetical protein